MKLSIVIPARNEAENITKTLTLLRDHMDQENICNFEILVVDDGSSDETFAIVEGFHQEDDRIRVVRNTGKNGFGRAVTFGMDNFQGDAVVVYMADASDAPEDVATYYYILRDEAECALGSRFMKGSKVSNYPRFKLVINRIANAVISAMFRLKFNDTTNAFKGYRREVIDGCRPLISPHFNLTIEIPLKAIVRGYSYKIVPIAWRNREHGVSSLRLQEQGSRYLWTLLVIWFEWLLTRDDFKRNPADEFHKIPASQPLAGVNTPAEEGGAS